MMGGAGNIMTNCGYQRSTVGSVPLLPRNHNVRRIYAYNNKSIRLIAAATFVSKIFLFLVFTSVNQTLYLPLRVHS